MKVNIIIVLFTLSNMQLFSQLHAVEFSFTNSLINGSDASFGYPCDNGGFCVTETEIKLERSFKYTFDYGYQLRKKTQLLFGAGLNFWSYEEAVFARWRNDPVKRESSARREHVLSNLLQLNVGIRNYLKLSDKLNAYLQNKIILGSGVIDSKDYDHIGLQPAVGLQHKLGENFNLLFSIVYTKYLRRPLNDELKSNNRINNPQSIGLGIGIAKKL